MARTPFVLANITVNVNTQSAPKQKVTIFNTF